METRIEVKLDLSGLDRLAAEFHAGIAAALHKEGEAWAADAQQRAPVKTGFLRDNIHAGVDEEALTLTLASEAPYSAFLEYGTRHMAARPSFTPALDQMLERLPETVAEAIRKETR